MCFSTGPRTSSRRPRRNVRETSGAGARGPPARATRDLRRTLASRVSSLHPSSETSGVHDPSPRRSSGPGPLFRSDTLHHSRIYIELPLSAILPTSTSPSRFPRFSWGPKTGLRDTTASTVEDLSFPMAPCLSRRRVEETRDFVEFRYTSVHSKNKI